MLDFLTPAPLLWLALALSLEDKLCLLCNNTDSFPFVNDILVILCDFFIILACVANGSLKGGFTRKTLCNHIIIN